MALYGDANDEKLQKIMMTGLSKGFVTVFETGHGHTKYDQVDINHAEASQYPTRLPHMYLPPAVLRAYSFANNNFGFRNIGIDFIYQIGSSLL